MKDFWEMVDELKSIDGIDNQITVYAHDPQDYMAIVPVELKDNKIIQNIIKKASSVINDRRDIFCNFNCQYDKGRKYTLYLRDRSPRW